VRRTLKSPENTSNLGGACLSYHRGHLASGPLSILGIADTSCSIKISAPTRNQQNISQEGENTLSLTLRKIPLTLNVMIDLPVEAQSWALLADQCVM